MSSTENELYYINDNLHHLTKVMESHLQHISGIDSNLEKIAKELQKHSTEK